MDNLYFLFLDEIYTPNLNEFQKLTKKEIFDRINHWHFGIAGTIFAASGVYDIYDKSRRIKERHYPNNRGFVFHYVDTLNKRELFSNLSRDREKYRKYTSSLESLIHNLDYRFLATFIDKHELIKKYGIFNAEGKVVKIKKIGSNMFPKSKFVDYNLYLLCLKNVLVDFYSFIVNRKSPARGIVVAEARGKREDSELRSAFQKIYYCGISSVKPTQLRRVILDLFIVPKAQDYIGTQITDMLIYPAYDTFITNHSPRTDHFIGFDTRLKRKIIRGGVKVIP